MKKKLFWIYAAGIMALLLSLTQQLHYVFLSELITYYGWIANLLITFAAFYIRFKIIDPERFAEAVIETSLTPEPSINPVRYLNIMPAAMVVGSIAGVVIHSYQVAGVFLYLINQVLFLVAFSGVIDIRPRILLAPGSRNRNILLALVWLLIGAAIYLTMFSLGLKNNTLMAAAVPVYMLSIIAPTVVAYIGLTYKRRSSVFRMMPAAGITSFVFSDTIIGFNSFVSPFYWAPVLLYPSWVLAIFLLQYAVLQMRYADGAKVYTFDTPHYLKNFQQRKKGT